MVSPSPLAALSGGLGFFVGGVAWPRAACFEGLVLPERGTRLEVLFAGALFHVDLGFGQHGAEA